MLKFSKISKITNGKVLQLCGDDVISHLLVDSRQLTAPEGVVFFAIEGQRHDGHQYLAGVYQQGLRNFIVEKPLEDLPELPDANIIKVSDSIDALQAIAAHHRSQFDLPVLGITGSNAKTIIKEWLYQLLDDQKVVKSPKSYNSQIGVPLSVWQLNESAELAIFEAGISQTAEMKNLAEIIKPTVGIFTNIGTAHDSGFKNRDEKIIEKALLFQSAGSIIYRKDHPQIDQMLTSMFPSDLLVAWSTKNTGDFCYHLQISGHRTQCRWEFLGSGELELPFSDPASIENVLHCLTFLLHQGYFSKSVKKGISSLRNISHRLALKKALNNCYLVDDTYNNDLAGLEVALDFAKQQPHGKETVLILSDIRQSSEPDRSLYTTVAEKIRSKGINKFYGIGSGLSAHQELFPSGSSFFDTTMDFLNAHSHNTFKDQLILIKGARDFAFEKIANALQEKHHGTVLEINLDALTHNLNYFRGRLHPGTAIMVMVKAFAYGSGSQEVAHLLQYQGVDYLAVAYTDEGVTLRKDGIKMPIMVMNPSPESFDILSAYQLEPEIYSLELLQAFQDHSRKSSIHTSIHLKLDTGMHRLGFEYHELEDLATQLDSYPLPVASIFSHLAAADDPGEQAFSRKQYHSFIKSVQKFEKLTGLTPMKHLVNSSGILEFPEFHLDMVRLGIGLYGVGGDDHNLRSISSLKTTISQIKRVPKGDTIGYGRQGVALKDMIIATIAIGYADGFDRRFGNGTGKVLVGDKLAPVVGNVCMDMTMVDISDCPASVGDTVIVFNDKLTIQKLAQDIGTIPYEILTQVSERVKRIYYLE